MLRRLGLVHGHTKKGFVNLEHMSDLPPYPQSRNMHISIRAARKYLSDSRDHITYVKAIGDELLSDYNRIACAPEILLTKRVQYFLSTCSMWALQIALVKWHGLLLTSEWKWSTVDQYIEILHTLFTLLPPKKFHMTL